VDRIVIKGGNPLKGTVRISGAKNSALPIMAACILSGGDHSLENIPHLRDIETMKRILTKLGLRFHSEGPVLKINSDDLTCYETPYEQVKTMRASILILGPLLARYGRVKISLPGGCAIGSRPINLHLKALVAMGADIHLDQGYVNARANKLGGAEIFFDVPTVTGTENIMMAAVTADGISILRNAAKEPEIKDLADMLRGMGAIIEGDGTDTIKVQGVRSLKPARHKVIPDRIEAGTYMIAGAMTRGDIIIQECRHDHLGALIEKLEYSGAKIEIKEKSIHVKGPDSIKSVDIKTMPFPGFPTDLQAQFMSLMCIAKGSSVINETVFENRFIHVSELKRMGADIEINGNQALVRGKDHLSSAQVMATDLRASASLILAGLVARGDRTEVQRIYHLDRGYEAMTEKFKGLGAEIWRVKE
jgi:UDP-N-acetylglucosamine 1-carboxyvinyltransferase